MLDVSRKELKYLVSEVEAARMRRALEAVLAPDAHNRGSGYLVRSLYFDTPFDRDFEEKVDGYDSRRKIRLRVYGAEAETAKLELKEKAGTAQRKRSLTLHREEAQRLIGGDCGFLLERPEETARRLYTMMTLQGYRPKCIVEYDRTAYTRKTNDIRITFDRRLRATEADLALFSPSLTLYPVADPSETTMEVKYNGFLFTDVKQVIGLADRMQISNSKYCRARSVSKGGRR